MGGAWSLGAEESNGTSGKEVEGCWEDTTLVWGGSIASEGAFERGRQCYEVRRGVRAADEGMDVEIEVLLLLNVD